MTNVLITGGTGLVGSKLSKMLTNSGYQVFHLTRNPAKSQYKSYKINVDKNQIDTDWLNEIDYIINLAGAGVADKKWTDSYKQEIYDSRIKLTRIIADLLRQKPNKVKAFISASAIGIYGIHSFEPTLEDTPAAENFLAKVCTDWEYEANKISEAGIRVAILRIGIVLDKNGGFIKAVSTPAKFGLGAALGSGKMITSWIHIEDLCRMFIYAIENQHIQGAYNAVAPNPATNKELTKYICKALNKPFLMPNVPAFALKLAMGEMADMVLSSQNISSKKICDAGFKFKFTNAENAIMDLLNKKENT
ncbi:MAG: TIGR01777 family oxidoreductase [Bacteroidia bacterium]